MPAILRSGVRAILPSVHTIQGVLTACVVSATIGCHSLLDFPNENSVESLLKQARPSQKSATIETLLVTVPASRLHLVDDLWRFADEQMVAADVRQEMYRNGLRAGVLGSSPTGELADLLQIDVDASATDGQSPWQNVPLDQKPTVTGHTRQMRPGRRIEIQLGPVRDDMTMLINGPNGLTGQRFQQVQCLYAMKWSPLPDGRAQVGLTPELHHGRPTTRFAFGEGDQLRYDYAKQQKVFEELRLHVPLGTGEMLLISSIDDQGGSLGGQFHTVASQHGAEKKLVLIRPVHLPKSLKSGK